MQKRAKNIHKAQSDEGENANQIEDTAVRLAGKAEGLLKAGFGAARREKESEGEGQQSQGRQRMQSYVLAGGPWSLVLDEVALCCRPLFAVARPINAQCGRAMMKGASDCLAEGEKGREAAAA